MNRENRWVVTPDGGGISSTEVMSDQLRLQRLFCGMQPGANLTAVFTLRTPKKMMAQVSLMTFRCSEWIGMSRPCRIALKKKIAPSLRPPSITLTSWQMFRLQ